MNFFKSLFGIKEKEASKSVPKVHSSIHTSNLDLDIHPPLTVSASPIGNITGSTATDFYVYEWFIKDTGEIFYVGKGRGNRFNTFHEKAYEAEKIRKLYDTSSRFIATNLTEEQAIELESKEITRILNETNDRLTNRIIPFFTERDNGYDRSNNTPKLQFETAPHLYVSEIEEHYFGMKSRTFDKVNSEDLKAVAFITRNIRNEVDVIYGGKLENYQTETRELLLAHGSKIIQSKFAKSVTAWIYIGDDYLSSYQKDQDQAMEKLGRNVPTYHLLDVWKYLKEMIEETKIVASEKVVVNASHNRVPLTDIRNLRNWEEGYNQGKPFWDEGEIERKAAHFDKAIELFNKARYNGYDAPALYRSYAMTYRKLKDYDNEIAIINEAIEREKDANNHTIRELKERRIKAIELKQKTN
ncbi:GIY-YIG nuclease family protein [Planococcus sp. MERTA32b]|nr:GIY-YIG nuclease family protein [Planococcus sp. MER TA 32b]